MQKNRFCLNRATYASTVEHVLMAWVCPNRKNRAKQTGVLRPDIKQAMPGHRTMASDNWYPIVVFMVTKVYPSVTLLRRIWVRFGLLFVFCTSFPVRALLPCSKKLHTAVIL